MRLILSDKPLSIGENLDEDVRYFDLSALHIANCVGCFGCWTKTPGKCVIRDDATKVYPCIAKSDHVLYVTRLKYGGYDTVMKTMLERALPIQQAFIHIDDKETHHVQRDVAWKEAVLVAYGDICPQEQEIFRQLVARNARNMHFTSYRILFVTEQEVEETVRKEVAPWTKSC